MVKNLLLTVLLSIYCGLTLGGFLSVIGPRTVQHRQDFHVLLTAIDYFNDEIVELWLVGNKLGDEIYSKTIKLEHLNEKITFELAESDTVQNYTLTAKIESENFTQSVEIITVVKRYSVFIQTDKPLYKPGDIVKFRVLVIDSDMKPFPVDNLLVEVRDGLNEVVREFDEDEAEKINTGVYVNEVEIATEPVMGTWSIKVTIDEDETQSTIQKFEVKEFVLPRFEVIVDTNHDITQSEGVVKLTVSAKYTFGEYVTGKAVITARVYDSSFKDIVQQTVTKTVDIVSKKLVEFNIKQDLKIMNAIRPYDVRFEVMFEETLTGQKLPKEVSVRIHKTGEYLLQLIGHQKRFKPGYPYTIQAIVKKFDGSIPTDKFTPIKYKINFFYKPLLCIPWNKVESLDEQFESNREKVIKNGVADLVINVPENATAMVVTAQYQDVEAALNITRHVSKSREYLISKIEATTLTVGKNVRINVEGNGEWKELFSIVIGRTGIVHHGKHANFTDRGNDLSKNYTMKFDIKTSNWMAPTSHLIVYYITTTGEIIYDRIKMNFDTPLKNNLDIKLSADKTEPRTKISIKVSSKPNSLVALLVADMSVTLLGSGNDIDKQRIAADMNQYNAHENYTKLEIEGNTERYLDFGESNAFILTNALDGESSCLHQLLVTEDKNESNIEREDVDPHVADDQLLVARDESNIEEADPHDLDKPLIRENFPETWIFEDFKTDDQGKITLSTVVPDTFTSFIVTGFATHPESGLGIAVQKKVTVMQEFFLKLYLPYSIRFGEVLKVDITVFNYIERPKQVVQAEVEMIKEGNDFEFVDATASGGVCNIFASDNIQRSKTISVPTGNGASTYFLIRALVTGEIKIKVKASTSSHRDEVEKMISVEHEGLTYSETKAFYIDLRNKAFMDFAFDLPIETEGIIWNSISIESSAIGDLLGPALANIHNLIRMPSGSSEQQFKTWISNIGAIRYLTAINKLTAAYEANCKSHLSTGYQQLLARKKDDGSFSLWGEAGEKSIWLTAYVAKLLAQVKELVPVNEKYISDALNFLKKRQQSDGNFPEQVHNYIYMKTKSQLGVPLTAFVAIAFLENVPYRAQYKNVIDKALGYIISRAQFQDNFALAIAAYALALNKHPATNSFLDDLKANAISSDDKMYWNREMKSFNTAESPSVNVEIAAYAIMAFVAANRATEAIPVMKWLMTQRSSAGGFYSTTDTAVGLQALGMITTVFHTANTNMNIILKYEKNREVTFDINPTNALTLQYKELDRDTRRIQYSATGSGFAFLQVTYRYNTIMKEPSRRFDLTVAVQPTGNANVLHLKICANFIPEGDVAQSGMTLIEVHLPSGYVYDPQTAELVKAAGVRRTETEKQKTIIILYFDKMTATKVCPQVKAIREQVVTETKQSVVKIYDFNNRNYRASAFYSPSGDTICGF